MVGGFLFLRLYIESHLYNELSRTISNIFSLQWNYGVYGEPCQLLKQLMSIYRPRAVCVVSDLCLLIL